MEEYSKEELDKIGYIKTYKLCPDCKTRNIYFRIKVWAGTFICLNCGERGFSLEEFNKAEEENIK